MTKTRSLPVHDFGPLETAISANLALCIPDIVAKAHTGHKHLYALALGFVDDLTGFFVMGATLEWAAGLKADDTDCLWSPCEWDVASDLHPTEAGGDIYAALQPLEEACDVYATTDEGEDETKWAQAYGALRREYEERTLAQLRVMRHGGRLRDAGGRELWVWCYYADCFDEGFDERSFAVLNDAGLVGLFKARLEEGTESLTETLAREVDPIRKARGDDSDSDNSNESDTDDDSDNDDNDGSDNEVDDDSADSDDDHN